MQKEYSDFKFTRRNQDGNLEPEAELEEYLPSLYSQPPRTPERGLGFNIATDTERGPTIKALLATGKPHLSSLVNFIDKSRPDDTQGVIFYAPVFGKGMEAEKITGVIATGLSLRSMVEAAIRPLKPQGMNIVIEDLSTAEQQNKILYTRSSRLQEFSREQILSDYAKTDILRESTEIDIGERRWRLSVIQAPGFYSSKGDFGSFVILLTGICFSTLLTVYIVSASREKDRINQQVRLRTQELNTAKQKTELILQSAHEGILGLDATGVVTFCNARAAGLLGRYKSEIIGTHYHDLLKLTLNDEIMTLENCPICHAIHKGDSVSDSNYKFMTKPGNYMPVDLTASPMVEDGKTTGAVLVFHDITERKKYEAHLQNLAERDQMTGLYNRRSFSAALAAAVDAAKVHNRKCAVIYMDLNGFKKINDEFGHEAGDTMIKAFGERINSVMRDSDTVARLGGDEFAVVCPRIDKDEDCLIAVERLLATLASKPVDIAGRSFQISSSIGVAFYPADSQEAEKLVAAADKAMYVAKKDKKKPYMTYKQAVESGAVEQD